MKAKLNQSIFFTLQVVGLAIIFYHAKTIPDILSLTFGVLLFSVSAIVGWFTGINVKGGDEFNEN